MNTSTKQKKVSIASFLKTYNSFSKEEKESILKKLYEPKFKQEWRKLDAELPDIDMIDAEIMKEIKAVRYGRKKN